MSHVGRIGASLLTTYFLCSSASLFLVFAHYVSRFVGATSSVNPEDGVWVKLATLGIAGALGGQIHSLHAFVSAAERKSLEWSSVPRILLSPVAAAGLAIVLFLTLDRWIAESSFNHPAATEQLVAAAGLAGLFTESVFKFLGVLAQGFDRLSGILVSKLLEIVHSELGSSNGNGTIKPACPSAKGSSPTRPDAVPLKVPREALSGASFRRDIAGHVPRGGDRARAVIAACAQAFPESAENATEFARGVCGLLDVTDFDLLPPAPSAAPLVVEHGWIWESAPLELPLGQSDWTAQLWQRRPDAPKLEITAQRSDLAISVALGAKDNVRNFSFGDRKASWRIRHQEPQIILRARIVRRTTAKPPEFGASSPEDTDIWSVDVQFRTDSFEWHPLGHVHWVITGKKPELKQALSVSEGVPTPVKTAWQSPLTAPVWVQLLPNSDAYQFQPDSPRSGASTCAVRAGDLAVIPGRADNAGICQTFRLALARDPGLTGSLVPRFSLGSMCRFHHWIALTEVIFDISGNSNRERFVGVYQASPTPTGAEYRPMQLGADKKCSRVGEFRESASLRARVVTVQRRGNVRAEAIAGAPCGPATLPTAVGWFSAVSNADHGRDEELRIVSVSPPFDRIPMPAPTLKNPLRHELATS